MDAAVGAGILGGDVMLAELFLDAATAFCLLGAGETRPVDEKTLTANETTDIAAFVRESAKDLVHRGSLLSLTKDGATRSFLERAL